MINLSGGVERMKRQLAIKLKIALVILAIGAASVCSYLMVNLFLNPQTKELKIPRFTYKNSANVDYNVVLLPNMLYQERTMEAGRVYISQYVDYISTMFKYTFTGDQVSDIKGEYNIVATIEATIGENENKKILWSKEYILLPWTSFSEKDKAVSISKQQAVRLDEYNRFVTSIAAESKVGANTNLIVQWNVNVSADTGNDRVVESLSPKMVIPLQGQIFEVGGELTAEKAGALEDTEIITLPLKLQLVIIYGFIIILSIVALIYLFFRTEGVSMTDPFEKGVRRIFKMHGERFVALNPGNKIDSENIIYVKSIDDIVKIADEISKPILYCERLDRGRVMSFYVLENPRVYIFELRKVAFGNVVIPEARGKTGVVDEV